MDNVDYTRRATIVKEIAHIHFTALTILQLGGNRIESAEGLARVKMAHIKIVGLCTYIDNKGSNNIISVGVIRKAAWPDLLWLDIRKQWDNVAGNYFRDGSLVHGCFPRIKKFRCFHILQMKRTDLLSSSFRLRCRLPLCNNCVHNFSCNSHPKRQALLLSLSDKSPVTKMATCLHRRILKQNIFFVLYISEPFCEVPIKHTAL